MNKLSEEPDAKGATEEQNEKIDVIKGDEVLGYEGSGREEHSGQNKPRELDTPDDLADNQPADRPSRHEH